MRRRSSVVVLGLVVAGALWSSAVWTGAEAADRRAVSVSATVDDVASLLPKGSPPLGLDGYCPIVLKQKFVWTRGDRRWGVVHAGRTYLFASQENQQTFLADPERYSPMWSGIDPIVALETGKIENGKREFGLVYLDRMILFRDKVSYDKFCGNAKQYMAAFENANLRAAR